MHWWNFLCNCNAFGSLEEIHLAKRNRTDKRYSYCRGFPMTINPDMCPTLLSKISLNSSLYCPHIFWDLPRSRSRSLKCDLFFVVWREICGHISEWKRLMIPTVKPWILLAVTRKKLLSDVCAGCLLCLDADILWSFTQGSQYWKMSHESLKVWPINLMGMMAAGRWRWEGKKLKSVCHLFE